MGFANGWRLDVGGWIDREQRFGLQAVFFILERQEADFGAFSDGNGNPLLARPGEHRRRRRAQRIRRFLSRKRSQAGWPPPI